MTAVRQQYGTVDRRHAALALQRLLFHAHPDAATVLLITKGVDVPIMDQHQLSAAAFHQRQAAP